MKERNGICLAGNMIVDVTYPVERWPGHGELTSILDGITRTAGGLVCNVAFDLAHLAPSVPLRVVGVVGNDADGDLLVDTMRSCPNMDTSGICREGMTSFSTVISDAETKQRTFFQYRGANARFDESKIDWDRIDSEILHVGYILLLDALDAPDADYGTKMARLLCHARQHGLKTSIDVVSEASDRLRRLVAPAMRYTDYCIINELEAQQTTGVVLRDADGMLYPEHMHAALDAMFALGVSTWAVIHCPEGGWGRDSEGNYVEERSICLPKGFIQGKVGAGDAFCSGVLLAAQQKQSLAAGIHLGSAAAVMSMREPGACGGIRTMEEALSTYQKLATKAEA